MLLLMASSAQVFIFQLFDLRSADIQRLAEISLNTSVFFGQCSRLLVQMAYFSLDLASGLYIYSTGRKQVFQRKKLSEFTHYLFVQWFVAWSFMDFYCMGRNSRYYANSRESHIGQEKICHMRRLVQKTFCISICEFRMDLFQGSKLR